MNGLQQIIPYTHGLLIMLWAVILLAFLRYWRGSPREQRPLRRLSLVLTVVSFSMLLQSLYLGEKALTEPGGIPIEHQLFPVGMSFFIALTLLAIIFRRIVQRIRQAMEGEPIPEEDDDDGSFDDLKIKFHKPIHAPEMKALLGSIPGLAYFKNNQSRYTAVSQSFADFLGRPIDEILGKTDYELFPNDIAASLHKLDREVLRSGHPVDKMESPLKRGDGQMRWLSSSKHPYRSDQGDLLGLFSISSDITEPKQGERALQLTQYAMNSSKEALFWMDRESRFIYVNDAACRSLGYDQEELLNMRLPEILMNVGDETLEVIWEEIKKHQHITFEAAHLRQNGTEFPIELSANYLNYENREYCCLFTRNIHQRKDAERQLELASEVIASSSERIMVTDPEGFITSVNPAFINATGYEPNEVIGKEANILYSGQHNSRFYQSIWNTLHRHGLWQGEIWNQYKNGDLHPEWLKIRTIRDSHGHPINYVAIYTDLDPHKDQQWEENYLGYHDTLTGLPGRQLLNDRLHSALLHAQHDQSCAALLRLDIDHFQQINEQIGSDHGGQLLEAIAERVQAALHASDTLARIASDEFAIVLTELESPEDSAHIAADLLERFKQPFEIAGEPLPISASIGISLYPNDSEEAEALIQYAEEALNHVRDADGAGYRFYDQELGQQAAQRQHLEQGLQQALEHELQLHYQPQFDINSGEIIGLEALLRWQHPEQGLLMPASFIKIAEETGFISQIGDWVLQKATLQAEHWLQAGYRHSITVNISTQQLLNGGLLKSVKNALEKSHLPAQLLLLEIEERYLMEHIKSALPTLTALREIGVELSLDNVGHCATDISELRQLQPKQLKLDRLLMQQVPADTTLIETFISIGQSLDLPVIAEGVESHEQLDYLRNSPCRFAQGYLLGEPLSAEQTMQLLGNPPQSKW